MGVKRYDYNLAQSIESGVCHPSASREVCCRDKLALGNIVTHGTILPIASYVSAPPANQQP